MKQMKDSGIEWIGQIPEDWEIDKAKHLFFNRNEKGNEIRLELLSPTQKYGVIPQSKYQEITGMKPVQVSEDADLSTFKTVHAGDFCISLSAYMGGFEYSAYEGVISPAYTSFYKIAELYDRYYMHLFKSTTFIDEINKITPQSVRVGRTTSYDKFAQVLLPVPPILVQKRIADFLDKKCGKIDRYITRQQQAIEKLKTYKQSVITETITKGLNPDVPMKDSGITCVGKIPSHWSVIRFKYITDAIGDGLHGTPEYDPDGEYYFLNGNTIGNENLVFKDNTDRLSESEHKKYKPVIINENTILITLNGATYGKTSFYHNEKVLLGKSAGYITLKDGENKYFLRLYLQSHIAKLVMELSLCGSTIANLSLKTLNEFVMPYPPHYEQEQIVEYLTDKCSKIDSAINKKQSLIDKLTEYKKSLIYEAVTGKLEV